MNKEFQKRSKSDKPINLFEPILIFRDSSEENNEMLTMEIYNEEIFEAMKQITP